MGPRDRTKRRSLRQNCNLVAGRVMIVKVELLTIREITVHILLVITIVKPVLVIAPNRNYQHRNIGHRFLSLQ